MKRKVWWLVIAVVAVLAGAAFLYRKMSGDKDEAAFQEQLKLARAEGIPTTGAEFAATIRAAKPEENAAPIYKSLQGKLHSSDDATKVEFDLLHHPSPASEKAAQDFLDKRQDVLKSIDQAAALPRCWFNRDWSEGPATLMPEFATMKNAAKLLGLRGSLAAAKGDAGSAIKNADEIIQISKHASEEGTQIADLVCDAAYAICLHHLADWAYSFGSDVLEYGKGPQSATKSLWIRAGQVYVDKLNKLVDTFPRPNPKLENRDELFGILMMIELCSTPAGRKELGLKEEDIGAAEKLMPHLLSQSQAKINIVKAERRIWAAYDAPPATQELEFADARIEVQKGLFAFPTAFQIYNDLAGPPFSPKERMQLVEARKLQYRALARALASTPIPKTIPTSDLVSPYDGKPLIYKFDGKQIVIEVSGGQVLKFPSDLALGQKH